MPNPLNPYHLLPNPLKPNYLIPTTESPNYSYAASMPLGSSLASMSLIKYLAM
jgi:hypothetical protein